MTAHITAGDLNGEYVVDEVLDDGRLVIRPDTSAEAIHRRQGLEPITAGEFEQHFGHLPASEEGTIEKSYPTVFPTASGRPATAAEFEAQFGDLRADNEP